MQKQVTLRSVFSHAFFTAIKHPVIWILAVFTSALGVAGEVEYAIRALFPENQKSILFSFPDGLLRAFNDLGVSLGNLVAFVSSRPIAIAAVIAVIIGIICIYAIGFFIINTSHGALIHSLKTIIAGKKVKIGEQVKVGLDRFWSVLGLNAIAKITVAVSFLLLAQMYASAPAELYFIIFSLVMVVTLPLLFVARLGVCGAVIEKWNIRQALKNGWQLFKHNVLLCFEVAIMLFLFYGFYFITVLQFTISYFTFTPSFRFFTTHAEPVTATVLTFLIPALLYIVMLTPFIVFSWAIWVFVFEAINRKESLLSSRIILALKKITGK